MKQGYRYKIWTDDAEEGALKQIENIAVLPFLFKHVAVMPDVHQGYGMPIGGVMATKDVIVPNAVGVDIGCGMAFVETDIDADSIFTEKVVSEIMDKIPVGFSHRSTPLEIPETVKEMEKVEELFLNCFPSAKYQIGTLGGGNHFIELQRNEKNKLCIMIHSGSRNIGKQVCDYFNKKAKELNQLWFSGIDPKSDLAFLPIKNEYGILYLHYMNYCVEFAKENRKIMMQEVMNILKVDGNILDCKHNYAQIEHHFNENVWVHRKGAVNARFGEKVIIPGAMGSYSYIAEGLGNKDAFESCSHGAGRAMSRKKAKETLTADTSGFILGKKKMDDVAEECKEAYKDIEMVIANELDLIKPIMKLKTVAVVKG